MDNPTNSQTPPVTPLQPKKTPMEMVSLGISGIVGKIKSLLPKPKAAPLSVTTNQPPSVFEGSRMSPTDGQAVSQAKLWNHAVPSSIVSKSRLQIKKIAVILIIFLVLVIVLLVFARTFKVSLPDNPLDLSTPSPSPTVAPTPVPTSKYAADSAVLKLEQDVSTLDQELINVDLDEDSLKPRPLLWEVNFQ